MIKRLIKKTLRQLKSPVVSLTRHWLLASGIEAQFQAIIQQLNELKQLEQSQAVEPDMRWRRSVSTVLDMARQTLIRTEHPLARGLSIHYSHCADLLIRHGRELDVTGRLMFKEDDWSVDYVKSMGIYVPGNEVEPTVGSKEYPLMGLLDDPECGIFLVIGQSNAANHGDTLYQPKSEVYTLNFMNMLCYRADDPLPGASGPGGSIWSRLGDQIIAEGLYRKVLRSGSGCLNNFPRFISGVRAGCDG